VRLARKSETKFDQLVAKKINPALDVVEGWLKKNTAPKTSRKKAKSSSVKAKTESKLKSRSRKKTRSTAKKR